MRKFLAYAFIPVSAVLMACAVSPANPSALVVAPVEVVETKVVVPVSCLEKVPSQPALQPLPAKGISAQTIARIEREKQLREYGEKVAAVMEACKELK